MGTALKYLREFFEKIGLEIDRRTATSLLILLLLLILLPVGLFLIKNQQIFSPKAVGELIQLGEDGCIKLNKDKKKVVDCSLVPLKLVNPFFNVTGSSAAPSSGTSSPNPGSSTAASSQPSPSPSSSVAPQIIRVNGTTNVQIQAALDQLKSSGGAVYLPAGTYTIHNKIQVPSNVTLFGDGIDQTVLEAGIEIDEEEAVVGNDSTSGQRNVVIRDMTIRGFPEGSGEAIKLRNLDGGLIYNVKAERVNSGILMTFQAGKGVSNFRISNCQILQTKLYGVFLSLGENNVVDHCTIDSGGSDTLGIGMEIAVEGKISGNRVISNSVSNGGHSYTFTSGNDSTADPSWVNSNNIVCYNTANGNHIQPIWDQKATNNVYVGNNVAVNNVGSNGFEEKSGTDPRCDIPAFYNIPAVPNKPSASGNKILNFLADLFKKPVIKEIYALGLASSLQNSPYKNMLVSYWKFDETSGNSVADTNFQSANGTGTAVNTTIVDGKFGKARMIPSGGYISIPNIGEFRDNVMSIAGWIKPVSLTGGASIWNQPEGTSLEFTPDGDGTLLCFIKPIKENQEGTFSVRSTGADKLTANAWNHVACTFDMSTLKLYINGRMVASGARVGWLNQPLSAQPVLIGKNIDSGKTINGAVDDMAYWNRALADSEISSIYNNGQGQAIDLSAANTNQPSASTSSQDSDDNFTGTSGDDSNDQFTTASGSPASISSVSSAGNGILRYRLAESQAGLAQAQWKEFALAPAKNKSLFSWISNLVGNVFAQDSDDNFTGTSGDDSNDQFTTASGSPVGSGGPVSTGSPTFSIGKQSINVNFQLTDVKPGSKQIWVEFIHPNGATKVDHVTFDLVDKVPQIIGLSCNLDVSKQNLKITVKGNYFGNAIGTATTVDPAAKIEVLGWNNTEVSGLLSKPSIPISEGQRFRVKVVRPDGFESGVAICAVDKSLVSLGARIFCREPGKFDATDVAVTLFYSPENNTGDNKASKVEEKATIDKDGEISQLKTQLQVGKNYTISIKAPGSLRRNATFTAMDGTTQITRPDGQPFILPVGDIAPKINPDGQINSLDRAELIRQWRILGTQTDTKLTGDFNRDTKVNSIDWACMQYDFGSSDDPVPAEVFEPASNTIKIPNPAAGTIKIPISSPSPRASVSINIKNSVKINVASKFDSSIRTDS